MLRALAIAAALLAFSVLASSTVGNLLGGMAVGLFDHVSTELEKL